MIFTYLHRDPTNRIRLFACLVLLGLGTAVGFHAIMGSMGLEWPWNSFLFMPSDRYNDWHNSVLQAASGDPYFSRNTPALAAYFPASYLIFDIPGGMSRGMSTLAFLVISEVLLFVAVFSLYFRYRLTDVRQSERGSFEAPLLLLLTLQCSYPLLVALDRGNIDLWIACGCTLFVATQDSRFRYLGLTALALCIATKGYPAAFLTLTVARRDYRGLAFCLISVLLLSVVGLLSFPGGIGRNIAGLQLNLHQFHERYVLGADSLFSSSDPYNALRLILSGLASHSYVAVEHLQLVSKALLAVYGPLISLWAIICTVFVLMVPAPIWRRVTAVSLVALLFPNVANDYKLCILFPGLMLLLLTDRHTRREQISLSLFALLMIPKSYYFFNGRPASMFINPLLLMALAWQVMGERDAWRVAWQLWAPISWYRRV